MPNKYGLSETELEIMEVVWSYARPVYFNELLDDFQKQGKTWKKQTLHTYLTRLTQKGALSFDKQGRKNIYQAVGTKEDFISRWTNHLVDTSFDHSRSKFMAALLGNRESLSQEELDELRKFLNE